MVKHFSLEQSWYFSLSLPVSGFHLVKKKGRINTRLSLNYLILNCNRINYKICFILEVAYNTGVL